MLIFRPGNFSTVEVEHITEPLATRTPLPCERSAECFAVRFTKSLLEPRVHAIFDRTTSANGMLADWDKATETIKIRYLRDGPGRMRAEDVSHPGTIPEYERIRVDDPVGGQRYMLLPYEKTMHVLPFVKTAGTVIQLPVTPPPPTEASLQYFLREFLRRRHQGAGQTRRKNCRPGKERFRRHSRRRQAAHVHVAGRGDDGCVTPHANGLRARLIILLLVNDFLATRLFEQVRARLPGAVAKHEHEILVKDASRGSLPT